MSAPLTSTKPGAEPPPLEFTYRTFEKERRRVLVGVDAIDHTGVWSVYDVPVGSSHTVGWLVQRLDGYDEKLDAASALAADYAGEQQRFHQGERSEQALADPLPRPEAIPLADIRKHTRLARRLAGPAKPSRAREQTPARGKPEGRRRACVPSPSASTALAA